MLTQVCRFRGAGLMRLSAVAAAVAALALGALPVSAVAVPGVTFTARGVPIPGFPHTGNRLGAGAALHVEYAFTGTEYKGTPPPISEINLYLPHGLKLHSTGFPACVGSVLEQSGPSGCKASAAAGPGGSAIDFVSRSGERVEEQTELAQFYAPSGGLDLLATGQTPVPVKTLVSGHYAMPGELESAAEGQGVQPAPSGVGYGPELILQWPLQNSGPNEGLTSVKSMDFQFGSAYKKGDKVVYYARLPTRCPAGGFPIESEVIFAAVEGASQPETVTSVYDAPCPVRHVALPAAPEPGPAPPPPVKPVCVSRRHFTIHIARRPGSGYRKISAVVNGHRVKLTRDGGEIAVPVDLVGLPKGSYTVRITLVTKSGRRITRKYVYRTCA